MPGPTTPTSIVIGAAADILAAAAAAAAVATAVATQVIAGPAPAINPKVDLVFPNDLIQANRGYYMNINFSNISKDHSRILLLFLLKEALNFLYPIN